MKKCKSCQSEIDSKAKKCPHCQADQRSWFGRHPILTVILGFLIFYMLVFSSISSKNGEKKSQNINTPQSTTQAYVFDIPTLIDKDLEELEAILGEPKGLSPTEQQISLGIKEWDKSFIKDGKELLVTYKISNNEIIDFFISTDDPSGMTQDKKHLLELGNLKENDEKYSLEFVKTIKNPSYFTGIKIIPK
jgi:hypothetical protein